MQATNTIWMGVGRSLSAHLDDAYDCYFQTVDIEQLIGVGVDACGVVGCDIGTEIGEGRERTERRERVAVELVVAQCRCAKAYLVHQCHHGVA